MINRHVQIIRTGLPVDEFNSGRVKEYRRAALEQVGIIWYKEVLLKHFNPATVNEYNHRRRSPRYLKYKTKMANRTVNAKRISTVKYIDAPLQLTGQFKQMVTNGGRVVTDAKKVTVYYRVPFYISPPNGKSSFIAEEIKETNRNDRRRMAYAMDKTFEEQKKANAKVVLRY